jgi:hypothetical protein
VKRKRALFVAYLGYGLRPFLDLDMRGWVVEADSTARAQRRHLPESIIRAGEQFQLNEHWFRERLDRGMDAVLIERGGAFDTVDVLQWARSAGLRDAEDHPAGHILLLAPRKSEH